MCSDGIDQKSTAHIPELPEAAVAKVVPKGLQHMLEKSRPSTVDLKADLKEEVSVTGDEVKEITTEYVHLSFNNRLIAATTSLAPVCLPLRFV